MEKHQISVSSKNEFEKRNQRYRNTSENAKTGINACVGNWWHFPHFHFFFFLKGCRIILFLTIKKHMFLHKTFLNNFICENIIVSIEGLFDYRSA